MKMTKKQHFCIPETSPERLQYLMDFLFKPFSVEDVSQVWSSGSALKTTIHVLLIYHNLNGGLFISQVLNNKLNTAGAK